MTPRTASDNTLPLQLVFFPPSAGLLGSLRGSPSSRTLSVVLIAPSKFKARGLAPVTQVWPERLVWGGDKIPPDPPTSPFPRRQLVQCHLIKRLYITRNFWNADPASYPERTADLAGILRGRPRDEVIPKCLLSHPPQAPMLPLLHQASTYGDLQDGICWGLGGD